MQTDGNASRAHLTRRPVSSSHERAIRSLGRERRSVREQAPLQDRLRERFSARRSGIKKMRRTDRMRRPSHHRHCEIKRWRSGEHGRICLKDIGRSDRGRLQRLATRSGRILCRVGLRRDSARAAIVFRSGCRFMVLDRREAEGAMIRNGQPRDRSQRHRRPAEGDCSVCTQHACLLLKKGSTSISCFGEPRHRPLRLAARHLFTYAKRSTCVRDSRSRQWN